MENLDSKSLLKEKIRVIKDMEKYLNQSCHNVFSYITPYEIITNKYFLEDDLLNFVKDNDLTTVFIEKICGMPTYYYSRGFVGIGVDAIKQLIDYVFECNQGTENKFQLYRPEYLYNLAEYPLKDTTKNELFSYILNKSIDYGHTILDKASFLDGFKQNIMSGSKEIFENCISVFNNPNKVGTFNLLKTIDSNIEKNCYVLSLMNENIEPAVRAKYFARGYIQKDLFKYTESMQQNGIKYSTTKALIDAAVVNNNRVKNKDGVTFDIIKRLILNNNYIYNHFADEDISKIVEEYQTQILNVYLSNKIDPNSGIYSQLSHILLLIARRLGAKNYLNTMIETAIKNNFNRYDLHSRMNNFSLKTNDDRQYRFISALSKYYDELSDDKKKYVTDILDRSKFRDFLQFDINLNNENTTTNSVKILNFISERVDNGDITNISDFFFGSEIIRSSYRYSLNDSMIERFKYFSANTVKMILDADKSFDSFGKFYVPKNNYWRDNLNTDTFTKTTIGWAVFAIGDQAVSNMLLERFKEVCEDGTAFSNFLECVSDTVYEKNIVDKQTGVNILLKTFKECITDIYKKNVPEEITESITDLENNITMLFSI